MIEPKSHQPLRWKEARTIATEISSVDLRLGEVIRQVAQANGYDSIETINVLERNGLPA